MGFSSRLLNDGEGVVPSAVGTRTHARALLAARGRPVLVDEALERAGAGWSRSVHGDRRGEGA